MNQTLFDLIGLHIDYLLTAGHRFERVVATRRQLDYFLQWANSQDIHGIDQLTATHPVLYLAHLKNERDLHSNKLIGIQQRRERLTKLRRFLEWLHRKELIGTDLARTVPKLDRFGSETSRYAKQPVG